MQKFYRNVFAAGAFALSLAACGDDIVITEPLPPPPPPAPAVQSVTVAPATQTLSINQEVTFSASVNADAGLATTVSWVSNNTAIASVDGNGKVKGIAPGTTTIVATSTVDAGKTGIATVTVVPNPPGIVSFNPAVANVTISVGGTGLGQATIQTLSGVAHPAITWTSLNTSVVTLGTVTQTATGANVVLNGVAPGTAVVRASATIGDQTVHANVNVTVLPQPSLSISSVTQGALTVPVDVSNVQGQIEITLNVNAREQEMDSVVVYIDSVGATSTKSISAGRQGFGGTVPPTGEISISVPTNAFTKNYAAGTTKVTHINGPTTVRAALYPKGLSGAPVQVINCSAGQTVICATPRSINLNNQDGWAADITKPTRSAISNNSGTFGYTYWGGPDAEGLVEVTLYSVIYNTSLANGNPRDVNTVAWTIGQASTASTCTISNDVGTGAVPTTRPWRKTFGYVSGGATQSCTGYEWEANWAGDRDNVIVLPGTLDNANTPMPATGLIPNALWAIGNPTPDSLRLDYRTPASIAMPRVNGSENWNWVNANWTFMPSTTGKVTDNGVGPLESSWTAYASAQSTGTGFTTVIVNGGAPLNETNTNCITGEAGCTVAPDGYRARATATDLLLNSGNSSVTASFGVDRTRPQIRYTSGPTYNGPADLGTYTGGGTSYDSTTYAAFSGLYGASSTIAGEQERFISATEGTADSVRAEAQDNRSGLSRSVLRTRRFAQGGASGTTSSIYSSTGQGFQLGTFDGWLMVPSVHVTNGRAAITMADVQPGYYTTTVFVVDKAGNLSGCPETESFSHLAGPATACTAAAGAAGNQFIRRTMAYDPARPQVIGVSPTTYTANAPANFIVQSQDDLEVIDARLRLVYSNVTRGDIAGTPSNGLVWTFALGGTGNSQGFFPNIANRFDNSVIGIQNNTLTIPSFTANVQETCTGTANVGTGDQTGPLTSAACGTDQLYAGDPISQDPLVVGFVPATKPSMVGVTVRDVFGSFVYNTKSDSINASTGVSAENVQALLSLSTPPVGGYSVTYFNPGAGHSCPAGGIARPSGMASCVDTGINFRAFGGSGTTRNFRAVQSLSTTTPTFTRVELYSLNSNGEWVMLQSCGVPAVSPSSSASLSCSTSTGTVSGSDNGYERYWDFTFNGAIANPTSAGGTTNYFSTPRQFRVVGVNAQGYGLFSTVQN